MLELPSGHFDPRLPVGKVAAPVWRDAKSAKSLTEAVRKGWTDKTLSQTDEMYGEHWSRGSTLTSLVLHQAHHRGEMIVLMRQAGLKVPGIYGPAKEEWARMNMQPPAI